MFALPFAVAGFARLFQNAARAFAMGAGLGDAENAARGQHLSASAAGRAGLFWSRVPRRYRRRSRTVELGDGDFLFAAQRGFFERDFQIVTQIVAALRLRRILAAAEDIFKNAAAAAAENLAENFERDRGSRRRSRRATGALARVKGGVAVLVVGGAFLRVAQRLVGLAQFLEFFLGGLVARIFVRVKFDGQLAVGLLDFLVARRSRLTPRTS